MSESLKKQTFKGVLWSGIERMSGQGVLFLVMLVIARILSPKEFGLIGMLTIFLSVAQSLIDSGFSQALIRKQNRTETDNSTVFYFNIVISCLIYLLLYIIAPYVSVFYSEPQLCKVMRVLCLIVIVNSFAVVQRALLTAKIDFKTQSKASFIAAISSGIFGIVLALKEFGVWAIVYQQLLNRIIQTVLLWYFSKWRPVLLFSYSSFKDLFSFGSKLMISGLIDTIYNNIYQIVIGKYFSASSLGHFTQAKQITNLPSTNVTNIFQRVTYPVLCTLQDDNEKLREDYRKLLKLSSFFIFPMMCCLAGVSEPLVNILLGEKWHFTSILIIPLCFSVMWYPVASINLNLLQVKGRSDLFLKLEIIKKIVGVAVLILSFPFGLVVMCYARIIATIISLVLNTYYTGKLIQVGFWLQLKDMSATLITSLLMFLLVYLCVYLIGNTWAQLFIGIVLGLSFWGIISLLFKFDEVSQLKTLIK